MTPEQMAKDASEAIQGGTRVTLTIPRGMKMPTKFPRGELLCSIDGRNAYSYDPTKVLAWLAANNLVKVSVSAVPNAELCGSRSESERT